MPEVLRPFTEKVFPQASWVCMPSNRICAGEEHSEALKRIVHLRDYLGKLIIHAYKSTRPHRMHPSVLRELASVTLRLIPGLVKSAYR